MVSATAQQPQLQMLRVLSINVDKFGWRGMRRERPEYAVFTLVSATVLSVQLMMVMATIWNRLCKLFLMNCGGYVCFVSQQRQIFRSITC